MYFSYRNKPRSLQQGATLIVALLVVLVVVAVVTRISTDYLLLFRSVENQQQTEQVHSYLGSTESLARELLLADLLTGSTTDSRLDLWAQTLSLPLPEGELQACILDLQGRINLNDLGTQEGEGYSPAQQRFVRLLQLVPVEPALTQSEALGIAHAVFDWADIDSNVRFPGGAETLDYQRLGISYRAANQGFVSVSELRQVAGITAGLAAALTPYLSVWGNGSMNINSLDTSQPPAAVSSSTDTGLLRASERAGPVLLRTINNAQSLLPASTDLAERIISLRQQAGGTISDLGLFQQGELAGLQWELEGVGVSSDFFQLNASMQVGKRQFGYQAVLQRRANALGQPEVIVRSRTLNRLPAGEYGCDSAVL